MSVQGTIACGRCGELVADGDRFCSSCGAAVAEPQAPLTSEAPAHPGPPNADLESMPPPQAASSYPPPAAYSPPPAYPPPSTGTNGMAIASLVLGIVWLWGLGSLLALIFGVIGKNQIEASGGRQGGRGLAIAGMVLGIVGLAGVVVFIILIVAASNSTTSY